MAFSVEPEDSVAFRNVLPVVVIVMQRSWVSQCHAAFRSGDGGLDSSVGVCGCPSFVRVVCLYCEDIFPAFILSDECYRAVVVVIVYIVLFQLPAVVSDPGDFYAGI